MNHEVLQHQTVFLQQAVEQLLVDEDGLYVDATFGRGGHSRMILSRLSAAGRLAVIDKDPEAMRIAEALAQKDTRLHPVHASFSALKTIALERHWRGKISGILLDLGVSSPQLDDPQRGFSFLRDGPLDMRMNPEVGISAATWLQGASQTEMAMVFRRFGEERYAHRMAAAIVRERKQKPFCSTVQLAQVLAKAHPRWEKHKHPATRAFQAIRIHINKELEDLQQGLDSCLELLKPGGRLVVISFHSLEDRMVKNFIRQHAQGNLPRDLAVPEAQIQRTLKPLGRAHKVSMDEIEENRRARSAIMRVAEKIK